MSSLIKAWSAPSHLVAHSSQPFYSGPLMGQKYLPLWERWPEYTGKSNVHVLLVLGTILGLPPSWPQCEGNHLIQVTTKAGSTVCLYTLYMYQGKSFCDTLFQVEMEWLRNKAWMKTCKKTDYLTTKQWSRLPYMYISAVYAADVR